MLNDVLDARVPEVVLHRQVFFENRRPNLRNVRNLGVGEVPHQVVGENARHILVVPQDKLNYRSSSVKGVYLKIWDIQTYRSGEAPRGRCGVRFVVNESSE